MPRKRNITSQLDPHLRVAGVDEAGRGPLAGPVSVAAVILDPARPIRGLDDSKQLTAARRDVLYARIVERALAWAVVFVGREEIDEVNIFHATMRGMTRALAALAPPPQHALIDGNRLPPELCCSAQAVVGGDASEPAISAASILAKVTRDRHMQLLDARYPGYGFARHKGYGVPGHLAALQRLGPCAEHRRSFAPVWLCLHQSDLFAASATSAGPASVGAASVATTRPNSITTEVAPTATGDDFAEQHRD